MRAPRHYLLLLVVYLHSSSKEKRETHISLTNSLFFSSSVLSLFIILSLFCSSLSSCCLSFLHFFVKKMQIHFPLLSKTCKKNSPPQLRDRQRKKREKKNFFNGSIFSETTDDEEITLSRLSLQKKSSSKRRACSHTHTRAHTHTLLSLSLSRSVNCPSTVVVVVSSVVCSRPLSLSLSFLVRKKKGEEKRKTTEDHPKTVSSLTRRFKSKRERSKFLTY